MRRHLQTLTAVTFVTWVGQRVTAVALPLVALAETGDAWTTGLVGGMAGLPLLTSAWWGRRLRGRLVSGRALAVVLLVQAGGLALVPVASATVGVGAVVLSASGLVTGATGALLAPAQRALTADLAEAGDAGSAARWLSWQDLAHRVSMIFAPPLGAFLVGAWGAEPLLWCETAAVLLGAAAMVAVPGVTAGRAAAGGAEPDGAEPHGAAAHGAEPDGAAAHGAVTEGTPTPDVPVRTVLRRHPDLAIGIALAGVGGLAWFAFSLGLALLGAELDRPGELVAAGMAGYGTASVAMSFVVPLVVDRLPRTATIVVSWAVLGVAFALLPLAAPGLAAIAVVSAVGGAAMPLGIAALNALISERTAGAERRAAFTAETVLHSGGASLGLLVGGAVIGWFGAGPTLVVAGLVQALAAVVAAALLRAARRRARTATPLTPARSPASRPAPGTRP
ncbi:MFS transporter [Puerhibacterium puerhi]|uniref:MFS transporter n=1 Tax=Puerhibacterium puerhi TaxID=2692623 RepID=UPI0019152E8B|nr:MFS transporter [Puerhibacterium puerhi]